MDEKKWRVYVHINKLNGKKYVGITSKPKPEHRWREGRGYHENSHFKSAINKYGWDNFEHVILHDKLSEHDAKELEKKYISMWNTMDNKFGYNMTSGGDGTPGFHPSDSTREKLSIARRRENLSEETLMRRSAGLKGRKFSEEHKRKIGDSNSKSVEMYTIDGVYLKTFRSASDAENETGVLHSHISQCCHGKRRTTGGYTWKFTQTA